MFVIIKKNARDKTFAISTLNDFLYLHMYVLLPWHDKIIKFCVSENVSNLYNTFCSHKKFLILYSMEYIGESWGTVRSG